MTASTTISKQASGTTLFCHPCYRTIRIFKERQDRDIPGHRLTVAMNGTAFFIFSRLYPGWEYNYAIKAEKNQ